MFQQYKLLGHFVLWASFFLILSNVTAGKMIDILGTPMPVSIFYFPVTYIIADIVTEVYGYAIARRVLYYTLSVSVAAAIIFQLVVWAPPHPTFPHNEAFEIVLGTSLRFAIAGIIAIFAGDIVNNYILAKMKLWFEGRYMSLRFVASTIGGEFTNTLLFFTIGLGGIIPFDVMMGSVLVATAFKTIVEIVLLPASLRIVKKVKDIEGVDHYDRDTDFNPFKV